MKTYNRLYPKIWAFETLHRAFRLASRGRRFRDCAGVFATNLEREIIGLARELEQKTYSPGSYRTHTIYEPKKRMISALPFRDRVVQHALCLVTMPCFERKMVFDLYSNRPGKGVHAAIRRAQDFSRRFRYVLKCDVSKFFPSIDHRHLKKVIRTTIRCRDTLWLFDRIIDTSNVQEPVCTLFPGDDLSDSAERRVGLPIGNLTSQWFGNIYLSDLDHWVKEGLECRGYVRYVDDFLLFSDSKCEIRFWRENIGTELTRRRLRINEKRTRCFRSSDGVTFLGQRIWPNKRRIVRENVAAARRRLRWNVRQYLRNEMDCAELNRRWSSWRGHAMQADGSGLIKNIEKELRHALGTVG